MLALLNWLPRSMLSPWYSTAPVNSRCEGSKATVTTPLHDLGNTACISTAAMFAHRMGAASCRLPRNVAKPGGDHKAKRRPGNLRSRVRFIRSNVLNTPELISEFDIQGWDSESWHLILTITQT